MVIDREGETIVASKSKSVLVGGKFFGLLNKEFLRPMLKSIDDQTRDVIAERYVREWFGEQTPEDFKPLVKLTRKRGFLVDVYRHYEEVSQSVQKMEMIAVFVRQYPNYRSFRTHAITRDGYLRYHIENYFQEIYIYKGRLKALLKMLAKRCKNQKLLNCAKSLEKSIKQLETDFEELVHLRGVHTHKTRLRDQSLEFLKTFELIEIAMVGDIKPQLTYIGPLYAAVRSNRSKWVRETNEKVREHCESFFELIKPIVFDTLLPRYDSPRRKPHKKQKTSSKSSRLCAKSM